MEWNILESGKTKQQYMEMGLCNQIQQNILVNLRMDWSIFMGDKYRNMKFIKVCFRMDGERVLEKDIHRSVKKKEFLIKI